MNTLEEILQALGSKNPFLVNPQKSDDGNLKCLTVSGNKAYKKLIDIVYCIGEITETDIGAINEIVECLDELTDTTKPY